MNLFTFAILVKENLAFASENKKLSKELAKCGQVQ